MTRYTLSCLFLLLGLGLWAQPNTTIIMNGTIHTGTGQVIEKGVLVIEQGKIVQVGKELTAQYKTAKIIDAAGKHIYPGLICMNNIMGLNEIDAIRATRDYTEQGNINPNVRSVIAYNTDSKILPTALFNGILYTQAVPTGGLISGSSSLLKTKAWNWEDAAVSVDEGVHLNWPYVNGTKEEQVAEAEKQIAELSSFLAEANQYNNQATPKFNARLAAMKGVLSGQKNLYIHANDARSLVRSVNFFKKNYPSIKLVLVGAQEAYLVIDFLKENSIPIVLGNIHRLPSHNADGIDQPYQTPAQLQAAGLVVALSYEGSWEARNLAYIAGTASAYGMSPEAALQSITLIPAKIMGVDKQLGSLEIGKDASILICNGNLLDMKESSLFKVFLNGEEIDLKNDQVKLFGKYKTKYKID